MRWAGRRESGNVDDRRRFGGRGISEKVHAQRRKLPEAEANRLSVRQELQADFLAGVWAHHALGFWIWEFGFPAMRTRS